MGNFKRTGKVVRKEGGRVFGSWLLIMNLNSGKKGEGCGVFGSWLLIMIEECNLISFYLDSEFSR